MRPSRALSIFSVASSGSAHIDFSRLSMYYDVAGVKGVADANNRSANEDIGAIVQFAGTRPSHGGMPVAHFSRALSLAHGLGQTKVFYNDFGQCTGFVVWALLAP